MGQPAPENPPVTGAERNQPPEGQRFEPGKSGNPGGRPKGIAKRVREKIGADGETLVALWEGILSGYLISIHPETHEREFERVTVSDRIAVSKLLAERGWGKPPQFAPIEDDDPLDLAERAASEAARSMDARLDELAARRLAREAETQAEQA